MNKPLHRRTFLKVALFSLAGQATLVACRRGSPALSATPTSIYTTGTATAADDTSPRDIGTRWELFVDDWLIETFDRTALRMHHPIPREVALHLDAPWEGPWSHYVTVFRYEDQYRMVYRGLHEDAEAVTAVATSSDGISWQRPNLELFEWEGSRANNIIWQEDGSHNFAPFLDTNPTAASSQRFKAVATVKAGDKDALGAFVSEDGYRWQRLRQEPIITDGAFDSQNVAFWDAYRGHYVAFYRDFKAGIRSIKTATSPDFVNWSKGEWLDFGPTPLEHLYTNATISYFRAPYLFLAFPKRFLPKRQVVPEHQYPGLSDGVFMSSRDGVHWDRTFMEAFLRPGRDIENWTERSNFVAWGILQTAPDELSLYWLEHYRHSSIRVRRGTLRLDGFASINAGYSGGEVLTHPLRFAGSELVLNYATSAAGSVRVEVQEADGTPIAGYTLKDSVEMYGDEIEAAVRWENKSNVASLASRSVRLRMVLRDADIFALRFRP